MPLPPQLRAKVQASPLASIAGLKPTSVAVAPADPPPVEDVPATDAAPVVVAPADPPAPKRRGRQGYCKVCQHDHKHKIEALYTDGRTPRFIADYLLKQGWDQVREAAIKKHFDECVAGKIAQADGADRSAKAFLSKIEAMGDRIEGWMQEFESGGHVCARCREADEDAKGADKMSKDWRSAAALMREARAILELYGKVLGHVRPDVEISVINNPQFAAIVTPICQITAACGRCAPMIESVLEGSGD